MTLKEFEEIKPQLLESFQEAILEAAKQCPEGFLSWLGMEVTPQAVETIKRG